MKHEPVPPMFSGKLDPQMAEILAGLPDADPGIAALPLDRQRALFVEEQATWNLPAVEGVDHVDLVAALAGRSVRLRLFVPAQPGPGVVVYAHGGGWVFGDLDSHHRIAAMLAGQAAMRVVAVDYRLSPEHRFPAPMLDVAETLVALSDAAVEGAESLAEEPTILAGDSAGANLALGAALKLRDMGRLATVGLCGQILFYGCYRRRFDTASYRAFGSDNMVLTTDQMRWFWEAYLGGAASDGCAEPLTASLHGLPPVHCIAAELDPLRDDSVELAERLREAGVACDLTVADGVVHACLKYSSKLARVLEVFESAGAAARSMIAKAV